MIRSFLRIAARLGGARLAAAVMLALALLALLTWVVPAHRSLAEREAALRVTTDDVSNSAPDPLRQFYARFPALEAAPGELRTLTQLAEQHAITLEKGEYRLIGESAGTLMRYEITLPVNASYPKLRSFIAAVLHKLPNCALDAVTFDRRKSGDALVDAKIRFTLYVQGRPQ